MKENINFDLIPKEYRTTYLEDLLFYLVYFGDVNPKDINRALKAKSVITRSIEKISRYVVKLSLLKYQKAKLQREGD